MSTYYFKALKICQIIFLLLKMSILPKLFISKQNINQYKKLNLKGKKTIYKLANV